MPKASDLATEFGVLFVESPDELHDPQFSVISVNLAEVETEEFRFSELVQFVAVWDKFVCLLPGRDTAV